MIRWVPGAVALGSLLACGRQAPGPPVADGALGSMAVSDAYAMTAPPGPGGSVYFTITNGGATADTIAGVLVGGAPASLHEVRRDGDLARMVPILPRAIPPGDSLALHPGGAHVMYSADRPIAAGDSLELVLEFAGAGTLTMRVPVRPFGVE